MTGSVEPVEPLPTQPFGIPFICLTILADVKKRKRLNRLILPTELTICYKIEVLTYEKCLPVQPAAIFTG